MTNEPQKQSDESIPVEKPGFLKKAATFAESIASRGLSNKKAEKPEKQLRSFSCHGDPSTKLPPCSERMDSKLFIGSFYCGACGCGDKETTQLINRKLESGQDSYCKLDFPRVHCPLTMPGFTNYKSSEPGISENPRKQFIELTFGLDYVKENSK
jgi:hypothetical protein